LSDLPLAIAETQLDITRALADGALLNAENPEATCANPVTTSSPVVPPVNVPRTLAVWGQDQAEGAGTCASLQLSPYSVTLRVVVEWRSGPSSWEEIGGCDGTSSAPASLGVGVAVVPAFLCAYDSAGEAAGKPHRAHAYLTNSATGSTYQGYSGVYLTAQDDDLRPE
jgi:hypothetical protein